LKHGLHLVCGAFWLGALAPLLLLARDGEPAALAAAARRFGRIAAVVVALLIFAGASLLWQLLESETAWWTSNYGRTVILKLGLVACLLALAAYNKWRLTPRLLQGDTLAALSLVSSIKAEMLIGGLILIATATLTTLYGPGSDM
jgi:copper resistance protein D